MTATACALLLRDRRLLLARRAPHKKNYPDCWDLVGGHVEPGETIEQALIREVEEEIGVMPLDFTSLGRISMPEAGACHHLFLVTRWHGGEPALLGDEHMALEWFTVPQACAVEPLALAVYRDFFKNLPIPP